MWFRNLTLYKLNSTPVITIEQFEEQLSRGLFHPCASNEPRSRGWAPVRDSLIYMGHNRELLLRLQVEERLLPGDVVAKEVASRAAALEEQQGYATGRKALRELKERVIEELMPRAFTRTRSTFVWIDTINGWLGIDTASQARAEEVIEHLRHCFDVFPLKPIHTEKSPTSAMADWLAAGEAPDSFTIDRDCELKAIGEEKAKVTFAKHPLADEWAAEIKSHLAAGKLPVKLALTWDDRISFVLTEQGVLKRLAFLDLLREAAQSGEEDQFDSDISIMTGEFRRLIPALIDELGGEVFDASEFDAE